LQHLDGVEGDLMAAEGFGLMICDLRLAIALSVALGIDY